MEAPKKIVARLFESTAYSFPIPIELILGLVALVGFGGAVGLFINSRKIDHRGDHRGGGRGLGI